MKDREKDGGVPDWAYEISGEGCGRDKNGVFHCVCGKCKPLRKKSEHRSDCSNDGCDSGYNADDSSNYETVPIRPLA